MASYDWQRLPGTELDVRWRDLHIKGHWALTNPDGSWEIHQSRRGKRNKIAQGFEGTRGNAERVIREWETRKMGEQK